MNGLEDIAAVAILLVRPGMLVIATPFLGAVSAPVYVRIGLTVLVALALAPVVAVPASLPPAVLGAVILRELAIGLALALAVRVLVYGAEFAGHFAGYSIGLSIGSLIDPQSGVRNNVLALLYGNLAILAVLAGNVHHRLMAALVDSYNAVPVGLGSVSPALGEQVARMLGLVFVIGVRIAAPVVVVLLIVEVALGLAGRVAPALNLMTSGAPIRLAVGLIVAAATVQTVPAIIDHYVPQAFTLAAETVRSFR